MRPLWAVASDVVVLDDDLDRMIASGALECAPVVRGSVGRDMRQPHRRAAFGTGGPLDVRKRRVEYVKLPHGLLTLVQAVARPVSLAPSRLVAP